MSRRILLVEDDELIGTMVEMNLGHQGYEVCWVKTGEDGLAQLDEGRFDLLVLDLMLPGIDGLAVAESARQRDVGTPVLMLTARGEVETKVEALDRGADDYLVKPFDLEELLARVRALIRRGLAPGEAPSAEHLALAGGEIDIGGQRFRDAAGREHDLSPTETSLLVLFGKNAGRTLTRADIIDEVWGLAAIPSERTVDNFILRLRRVVGDDAAAPRHLTTVRGRGYRYDP